jgi:hypothetical protein
MRLGLLPEFDAISSTFGRRPPGQDHWLLAPNFHPVADRRGADSPVTRD